MVAKLILNFNKISHGCQESRTGYNKGVQIKYLDDLILNLVIDLIRTKMSKNLNVFYIF